MTSQLQVESTMIDCLEPSDEDKKLYVHETVRDEGVCCPVYRRVACLAADGTFYQVRAAPRCFSPHAITFLFRRFLFVCLFRFFSAPTD